MAAGKTVKTPAADQWEDVPAPASGGEWETVNFDKSAPGYVGVAPGPVADAARKDLSAIRSDKDLPPDNPEARSFVEQPTSEFTKHPSGGMKEAATTLLGIGRGGLRTLQGLDKLTGGHLTAALGINPEDLDAALKPRNMFDLGGQIGETGLELTGGEGLLSAPVKAATAAPKVASLIARASEAAPRLMKAAGYLGKAAIRGGAGYGVAAAESGSTEGAKEAGAMNAVIPIGLDAIGAGSKWVGSKMLNSKIRLTAADRAGGADVKTLFDEGLSGLNLRDTFDSVANRIKDLTDKAKSLRAEAGNATSDVTSLAARAEDKLLKDRRFVGKYKDIQKAIGNWFDDVSTLYPNGKVPVEDLNELKTGTGYNGNWAYGKIPRDASAEEIANSALHSELKSEVESLTPNDAALKEVNGRIGKLLPIQRAILRRIPVDERMNPVGLFKGLALATHNPMLLALDMIQRNIPGATATYRAGQTLAKSATAVGKAAVGWRQRRTEATDEP